MSIVESFGIEDEIDEREVSGRYEVKSANRSLCSITIEKNNKPKRKFPLLFYIFLLSFILLIIFLFVTLVVFLSKKEEYEIDNNPFEKPEISNHNYTNIKFKNDLQLILIQVDENDTAGGSIAFNTGYLNNNFKPGYLKLAFLSLIDEHEMIDTQDLTDFLGEFDYSIDEDYSTFSFKILNAGFFDYLKKFSKLTYLEDKDKRFDKIKEKVNLLYNDLNQQKNNLKRKENHILEYLIYGYKKEDGTDIFPQGNSSFFDDIDNNGTIEKIKNIMKSLLKPSNIKIVLNSHFKMSLMKNKFIKYFNNIINKDFKDLDTEPGNYTTEFNANKIIYMNLKNYETNYIKIIYFIHRKKNITNDREYQRFYLESGYFNYLKYILSETNNESLYYNLTHSENFNIKSLSTDFELVLKSKIKFSINIDLNYYSYDHLKEIIYIVYEYIDKIRGYINLLDNEDKRMDELDNITERNFSFTEDLHDITSLNNQRAINLFRKRHKKFFLKDIWIPRRKTVVNLTRIQEYISQLIPKNSVIIIGINNNTFEKKKNLLDNSDFSYMFNNITRNEFFDVNYSIDDLDNLGIKSQENLNYKLNYIPNVYITKYDNSSKLTYNPDDKYKFIDSKTQELFTNESNYLRVFYYRSDTSFKIPKVYIILKFFHPYLRANGSSEFRDQRFFDIMIYNAYIKREINLILADAIRAGNSITMNYNQNLFYIDIFAYEDIAYKILSKIKDIIMNIIDTKTGKPKFFKNFEIYREAALEDFLNFQTISEDLKMRFAFYEKLVDTNNPDVSIYNYYKFPRDEYIKKKEEDIINDMEYYASLLNSFIISGHIYGYYSEEKAKNLVYLFNEKDDNNFINALERVNLTLLILNSKNFTNWMNKKVNITYNVTNNSYNDKLDDKDIYVKCKNNITGYRFLHWSTYNLGQMIFSNALKLVINNDKINNLKSNVFSQSETYIQFNLDSEELKDDDNFTKKINELLDGNKKIFKKEVDSVGDRLYYLYRSLIIYQYARREDMKSSAITLSDTNIHKDVNYTELDEYKYLEYDKFKTIFNERFSSNFHVDLFCKKN